MESTARVLTPMNYGVRADNTLNISSSKMISSDATEKDCAYQGPDTLMATVSQSERILLWENITQNDQRGAFKMHLSVNYALSNGWLFIYSNCSSILWRTVEKVLFVILGIFKVAYSMCESGCEHKSACITHVINSFSVYL